MSDDNGVPAWEIIIWIVIILLIIGAFVTVSGGGSACTQGLPQNC